MGARAKGPGEQMVGQPVELTVVEAPWAIVDSVLHATVPLHEYEPGSTGPPEAERLVTDVGGWIPPAAVVA
jgi:glucose-6-phosphate 1-dehydrogenase